MKKIIKWVLILSFVSAFFAMLSKQGDSTEEKNDNLTYTVVSSNKHISGRYYFCDVLLEKAKAELLSEEELNKEMERIADKEASGECSFYYSKEGIKAQSSSSYAEINPDALKDYVGKVQVFQ